MAQRRNQEPVDTLEELQSLGERLAQWVGANPAIVLGVAALILATAGAFGGYRAWSASRAERASAALSTLRSDLIVAMGGSATDTEVPEPANPETARTLRTEFANRYLALAEEWGGTPTGGLALLEAGSLFEQLGNAERALEVWTRALAVTPPTSPAAGILHARIGRVHEDAGRFGDAAKAYEAAAAIPGYPLAAGALADAARCWSEAGQNEPALAAWRRLKADHPEYRAAHYVDARLSEMELRAGGPPAAAPTAAPEAAPANP